MAYPGMQSSIPRVGGHRRTAFPWSALRTLLFHHFQTCCSPTLMFSSRTSTIGNTAICRLCPTGDWRTSVTSLSPHRAVSLVLLTPRLAALSRVKQQGVALVKLCVTWTLLIVYNPTKSGTTTNHMYQHCACKHLLRTDTKLSFRAFRVERQ